MSDRQRIRSDRNDADSKTSLYGSIVAVCLCAVWLSLIAVELMPSCTVDSVYGVTGCGVIGSVAELLVASGFFWLVINTLIALPLWKLIAFACKQTQRVLCYGRLENKAINSQCY